MVCYLIFGLWIAILGAIGGAFAAWVKRKVGRAETDLEPFVALLDR